MSEPEDPLPISALQHWAYCPRQCGLIHLEQAFDDLQLAAQAMCLESMTGRAVAEGALFYAKSKRRRVVPITDALRAEVAETAGAVRAMLAAGRLPAPTDSRRCKGCSLRDRCQPQAVARLQQAMADDPANRR